jgi:hypothetical protein
MMSERKKRANGKCISLEREPTTKLQELANTSQL